MKFLADEMYAACKKSRRTAVDTAGVILRDDRLRAEAATRMLVQIRESRRFFIDPEATKAATILGCQHPDVLNSMLRRARAPIAKVWLEWPIREQVEESGSSSYTDTPDRTAVYVERLHASRGLYRLFAMGMWQGFAVTQPLAIRYDVDEPLTAQDQPSPEEHELWELCGIPWRHQRQLLMGAVWTAMPGNSAEEIAFRTNLCHQLASHARWEIEPVLRRHLPRILSNKQHRNSLAELLRAQLTEWSGTWRQVVTMFALINARDYVDGERVLRSGNSRLVGNKIVPYLDHWLVSLKLPRKIVHARLTKEYAEAIPKRRHEVIGHWKHSRTRFPGLPGCEHVFVKETRTY